LRSKTSSLGIIGVYAIYSLLISIHNGFRRMYVVINAHQNDNNVGELA
jgi:hypothetical protein